MDENNNKNGTVDENVAEELLTDDVVDASAPQEGGEASPVEGEGEGAEGAAEGSAEEAAAEAASGEAAPAPAAEKPLTEREKFVALGKNKPKVNGYTAYTTISGKYSVEEGLGLIVKHLSEAFFNLDEDFMKLVRSKTAFVSTKMYAPVYRMKAKANYYWRKGKREAAEEYSLAADVENVSSNAPAYLKPTELAGQPYTKIAGPITDERLLLGKKVGWKDCEKSLKAKAATVAPDKKADVLLTEENYEVAYVPVLKAEITYGGKTYTQWVNLVNGECKAEYAVSPQTVASAEKTMQKVGRRKRTIFGCFLYSLTFTVLNILFWQLSPLAEGIVGKGLEGTTVSLILGGVSALILLMWGACFAYKKQKLIDRAVKKGKAPSAKGSAMLSLLSLVAALASVALFAVFVLL